MARKSSLLNDLILWPWWANAILALVSYWAFKHGAGLLQLENIFLQALLNALPHLAGFTALVFTMTALLSAVHAWRKGKLFRRQTSVESIKALSWKDFEYLCSETLRRQGYSVIENLRGGADGGVDLVVRKDGKRILVQCKNWRKRPVSVATVRELYGVVQAEGADGGMVLSSGHFTNDARKFAKQNGITLMDGTKLLRKIQHIPDTLPTTPQGCPKCGSPMVPRRAKRGRYAGTHFYGCSRYPRCRGIRN